MVEMEHAQVSLRRVLMILHVCICFCKTCIDFCSCERNNNRDGLKTPVVRTLTNFEFVGVSWAHVRTIISGTSFKWKLLVSSIFLKIF